MKVFTLTYSLPSKTDSRFLCDKASSLLRFLMIILMPLFLFTQKGTGQVSQTFNSSSTFTVPAGVNVLQVEAWGAGGAGGGNTTTADGGGGGGGGAYSKTINIPVTPGATYTVTVGTGGIGSTGDGTAGGDSWFNTTGVLLAKGGNGGISGTLVSGAAGGTGGAAGAGVGTVKFSGGNGGSGRNNNTGQGGPGGSSAGTAANGTSGAAPWTTVTAAAAPAGGGTGGNGGTSGNNGNAGSAPGAGGGGSGDKTGSNVNGAGGSPGRVIITYFTPTISGLSQTFSCSGTTPTITITGTNFTNPSTITFFNGVSASSTFVSSTSLTTVVPVGASTGPITVTTPSGSANSGTFTIVAAPTANAGAGLTAICQGSTSAALGGSVGGSATGGTWSTPAGGTFNPNATTLNATWTPPPGYSGTATLTLTTSGGSCSAVGASKNQLVNPLPTAAISYAGNPFCNTVSTPQSVTQTGIGGGTYSSAAGLNINTATGEINPSLSTPGSYTVTYSFADANCSNTTTASVTITALPVATFSYTGSPYCSAGANPSATLGSGATAGVFSSASGLNFVSTSTGLINVATSTVNTYTVTNTIAAAGGCALVSATSNVTINAAPTATITYAGTPFCTAVSSLQSVTQTGTTGGTYTSTAGLSINTTTGDITPSSSTAGTYIVTYSFNDGTCSNTTTTSVTIAALPTASVSGTTTVCQNVASPNITFTNPQIFPITITYNINGGGNTTINVAASSTATVAVPTAAAGSFAYNLVSVAYQSIAGCSNAIAGTAIVTVNPTPLASISGTVTVCRNGSSPNITFTNPQSLPITVTYNINAGGNTTVNIAANATANVAAPTTTAGTFNYNLVSVAYQAAPTCSNAISGIATVTVNPTPSATISGAVSVCQNGASPNVTFTNPQSLPITITYNINGAGTTTVDVGANTTATVAVPTATAGVFNYNMVSVIYQSAPACTTSITGTATVTVRATPIVSISGTTTVCQGGTAPNITFTNPQNLAVTVTYNINGGSNATVSVAANSTATVAVSAASAGTFNYNLVSVAYQAAPSCTNAITGTATVTVNPTPTASITGTASVCLGGAAPDVTFNNPMALPITITYKINAGGNLTIAVPANSTATVSAPTGTAGTFVYTLQSVVYQSAPTCSNVISGNATITVRPTPVASISGTATVCQGGATNITFTNPQAFPVTITYTINGGSNTTVAVGASTSANVAVPTGSAGTFIYSLVSVVYQSAPACSNTIFGTATATVNPTPTASVIGGTTVCQGSTAPVITFTNPQDLAVTITYKINSGGNLTINVPANGTNTVNAPTGTAGTFNYNLVSVAYQSGPNCTTTISGTASVVVNPTPTPTISGGTTVCQNAASPNITFTNPQALAVTITYNINGGANANINVGASTSATVAAPTATAGVFNYNLVSVVYQSAPACNTTITGTAVITVRPTPIASISGSTTVCRNASAPNITFTNPQVLPVSISYNINGGGTLTIAVAASSTATVAAPTTTAGTFNYNLQTVTYQSGAGCSNTITGTATVIVNPTPVPTISGGTTVCQNGTAPNVTFTNPQAIPVTITYNINGSGAFTVNVGASTTATVATPTSVAGTFVYNLVSVVYQSGPVCTTTISGNATVIVRPTPVATISGAPVVCLGATSPNITFTNPQALPVTITYNINGSGTPTVNVGANTSATVAVPTGTANVFNYNLVSVIYQSAPGCSNSITGTATATVNPLPLVSTPASSVCVNSTITLSPSSGGTWISSNNAVATVTNAGVVTGVSAGSATFTYTLTSTGCKATTSSITVNALPVIAPITSGAASICVNDITVFTNATSGGAWSEIDGTGSATIDAGGLVTGVAAGTVTIVYTYSNGTCSDKVTVPLTINATPSVSPIGGGAATVCANGTTPAFTNATPGGGWSIIDATGSATVDAAGVVSGVSAGSVTVLYTVSNGTCTNEAAVPLTVNPLPAVAAIGGGAASVCVNAVTPAFTNATGSGTWSVTDATGSATITSAGVVTALTPGTVTINYTVSDGTCTNKATKSLTINPLPTIAPIANGTGTVCVNATTAAFTDATPGGLWSVLGGTGTANINASGVVTGLTPGTVTVFYTYTNGTCSDKVTTSIVVNALPVAGAITGASAVCQGNTISLSSNATGAGSLGYSWNSSNTTFASVTNTGVVTGIAAGTSNITYTVTDGNGCFAVSPAFPVGVGASPSAAITSGNTAICNGGSTNITGTVTANGAWTLTLSDGSTATGTGNGSFSIAVSPVATATYTVTSVTDISCTSLGANLTGAAIVTVNEPVVIGTQPLATQTVCSGSSVSFTVAATGTGLTYQWRKGLTPLANGGNISGVSSATLVINPVAVGDAASDYNVVVSAASPCNSVASNSSILIVNQAVSIGTQPAATQTLCSGSTATFTVSASGTGIVYQWRKNGTPLTDGGNVAGALTNTLTLSNIISADAAVYTVTVSGTSPCSLVISAIAALIVNTAVAITDAPSDAAVCATFPVDFTVAAMGSGLTYQWYKGTFPGTLVTNNANISGATASTLHFNQANIADIDDYYVVVSGLNPCTPVQSSYAHLSVDRTITITTQPVSQQICVGGAVSFSVVADANGDPLLYQWRKNGTDIPGENGATYTIATTAAGDAANYDVVVTGIAGCTTSYSAIAVLAINPLSVGGTVGPSTAVCVSVNNGTLNLTGQTGNVIRWESSTDGGFTWVPIANTTTSLTYTNVTVETMYRVIVQSGVCAIDPSAAATISFRPVPDAAAAPSTQTICSGTPLTTIVLSGSVSGTIFNWTRDNIATAIGIAASGSGDISGSLTNTTASPFTTTFTITPTAAGCPGNPITATVTFDVKPTATATPSSQTICSGSPIASIVLSGTVVGTTYTWTRDNSGTVTGITASGSGDISGSLTNTTAAPITVTFTITPSANGCFGTPVTATVLVNPTPNAVAAPLSQIICSATPITTIALSGSTASTTFNWTRDNTATITGIAASGAGNISGSLTNTALTATTVTFTITPIANGCPGLPITSTVLVNPSPDAIATPSSQVVCSANPIGTIVLSSTVPLATYTWTRNNTASVTGIAASGSGNISGTLTNTSFAPITVTFTISPTANTCPGVSTTATVLVNPTPNAVASPSSQTLCSGTAITTMALTGSVASTTFNWTRNNTATVTGITTPGSGNISGTLLNTTNALVTVTFNITPTANSCPGTAINATVAVKPTPIATATNNVQTVCSGLAIANVAISNSNAVPSTTYSWTRDNTTNLTGIAASGTGTAITGTLTNTTNVQQVTTFTITATAAGCSSTTTVVITVNPKPVMTSAASAKICYNSSVNLPLSSTISSTYTWIAAANANVTGESITTQSTATVSDILVNTSTVSQFTPKQTVVYTVVPTSTAGGCVGNAQTVNVIAYPRYNVSFYEYPSDDNGFTICDGDLVGGGGQNDIDLIEGQYTGSTLLWQYSIGTNAGPWSAVPGPHFNNLIHDTLPDPPSIFSPIGSYYFRLLVDGCPSDTLTMSKISTLTINAGGPNNTVCETGTPSAITLAGSSVGGTASTTVGGTWSITSLSPANGGNIGTLSNTTFRTAAQIPTVTYTPPANYAGVVTLTLTSNDPDGNGPCAPLTETRTITVTQAPIISNASTMAICNGTGTNINLTSVIPSTYTWTVGTITGGITGATAGAGNSINQVLANPSATVAGTVQYVVTPTPINPATCAAVTANITVTVTPAPAVALSRTPATICQGNTSTLTAANTGGTNLLSYSGTSGNINAAIPDDNTTGISSVITLGGSGGLTLAATDVVQVTLNINHTYDDDLDIYLVDPSGNKAMLLSSDNGGAGDNYTNTVLRTDAGNVIGSGGNNTAPFTGTYRPEGTISTAPGVYTGIPNAALLGASIDGDWTIRVFDDANADQGTLLNWSLSISRQGVYTSVFSGPASIGSVVYSGVNNATATAIVTPAALGLNSYTVTTTDAAGCTRTSASVDVTVNPAPTLTGASQQAPVCAGSSAQINLTGLLGSSIATINYTINGGATQTVTGVVASAGGAASFNTIALTSANNGQTLRITGVTITSATPGCLQAFTQDVILIVNPVPTLTGASLQANVCIGSSAQINLSGMAGNTTVTITYTIAAGAPQTATGVVVSAGGTASFNTIPLTFANNGQTLQITGVSITSATPNCGATFTRNVTLLVNPTPTLSSTLTPSDICSAATFSYTATSATGGATFGWTRAAVPGISQASGSGTGNIAEALTNTTSLPILVTYVYTTSAAGCSNAPGQNVVVRVNPSPTLTAANLAGAACDGAGVTVNLVGLLPGTTSTIFYAINNVAQTAVTGVVANGAGAGSFVSSNVTSANAGQILKITGVSTTSSTPSCAKTVNVIAGIIAINPLPTLSAVSQTASVCGTGGASITLTGMIASSTNNTINYSINGVPQAPVTGVNANAGGVAMFVTTPLTIANNGQPLTVTGITNGTCSQSFTKFTILVVKPSYVWLGVNTNWFDVQNWCGGIPDNTNNVLIPGSLSFYPVITTGTPQVKDITIQPTASVKLTGTKMQVAGAINNAGTFDAIAGTIELNGTTGAQTISGSQFLNKSMEGLLISNTAGVNVSNVANDSLVVTDSLAFGNVSNTTLNTGDNITIASRSTKTARVADITNAGSSAGNAISGKVIVERYFPARRSWRMLTVPIQAAGAPTFNAAWQEGVVNPDYVYANHLDPHPGYGMLISGASTALGFDPSPNNNPSVKLYNPSNDTWAGIGNTLSAKVTDSTGYMVFVRGDRSTQISLNTAAPLSTAVLRAKGQLKTGLQNFTIPNNSGFYNIVGNPYASTIDFRKVTVSGGIGSGYVVWDPNLTGIYSVGAYQYFYFDGTDNRVFPGSGSYGPANSVNNYIQSSQAFLVQRSGSGTVSIDENAKASGSTSTVFRPASAPNFGKLSTLFTIANADGTKSLADGALSLFDNSFSNDIDLADFRKVNNIGENFAIEKNNAAFGIEKRQPVMADDTIFYKMTQLRLRNYQLAIAAENFVPGTTAFLEDKYLQTRTPLDMNGTVTYNFTVTNDSGAWNPRRFKVVFKAFSTVPVTITNVKAYRQNNHINIDWKVENELNIQRYELEKSIDGIYFANIETFTNVRNNNNASAYSLADANPVEGYNYYRIRSVENSGRAAWSSIAKVLYSNGKNSIAVYPNPVVNGTIHLQLTNQQAGKYKLRLLNSIGQSIAEKQIQHPGGTNVEVFSFDTKIPQGAYQLEVTKPDGSRTAIALFY